MESPPTAESKKKDTTARKSQVIFPVSVAPPTRSLQTSADTACRDVHFIRRRKPIAAETRIRIGERVCAEIALEKQQCNAISTVHI